jgi:hypothetical protein
VRAACLPESRAESAIRGGCLDGLQGILAQSSQKTLVISIECIERSVAVTIEGYELEMV